MMHAVKHIHFVGAPGEGPRRPHAGWPMPAKRIAAREAAK